MANHEIILNALLNIGIRQRDLENVLASNCVLDWFGRTVSGRAKVVNYYLNSNNCYEHSMANAETIDAFEERLTHMSTRDQPIDNSKRTLELFGNEQWYDCETHTPVDLKETLKTPPRPSFPIEMKCPPAPNRRSLLNDSEIKTNNFDVDDDDDSDTDIEGIQPLDRCFDLDEQSPSSSKCKRQRRDNDNKSTKLSESISLEESRYSDLSYLEVTGTVTIRRRSASTSRDECDRRECKMQVSYRVNKEDANDVQVALIVYKNVNTNLRSRRNLMTEFEEKIDDSQELLSTPIASTLTSPSPSSASRCRTVIKDKPKTLNDSLISSAPPCADDKVTKAIKRPISSRNCLRF